MKLDVNKIPAEGLVLREELAPKALDLDTQIITIHSPVSIIAEVSKISNTVCVHVSLHAAMRSLCSLCLKEFETDFQKEIDLNYPANGVESVIDLTPEIREEIILDYPIKPMCSFDCKGLCQKCGKNLNEEKCNCK